ncbi:uncharacterized protein LOC131938227 [Physella acuta]|uniref:uncharacterized protein LOC131938227 n=1 Tax=Physella acuta TaxID=109671 RepID=UPI0027DC4885|nr:uncharacterized protein LOC131938227 [Physella acuta]
MLVFVFLCCLPFLVAGEECKAYKGTSQLELIVNSHKDCFERCKSNPKCIQYDYSPPSNCMNFIINSDVIDPPTSNYGFVFCNCSLGCTTMDAATYLMVIAQSPELSINYSPYYTYKHIQTAFKKAFDCYKACANDDRCFMYAFDGGICSINVPTGSVVDPNVNKATSGFSYCKCDRSSAITTVNPPVSSVGSTTTSGVRLCYKCKNGPFTSKCHNCPAPEDTVGWKNTKLVKCTGPCVKTTSLTTLREELERSCSDGKFPSNVIQADGCVNYLGKNTCFCSKDLCN